MTTTKKTPSKKERMEALRKYRLRVSNKERKRREAEEEKLKKEMEEENEILQQKAKENRAIIWTVFFGGMVIISVVLLVILILAGVNADISFYISVGVFVGTILLTLILGYVKTPQGYLDIVEVAGKYVGKPMKPGPHILFPYFEMEIISLRAFMGMQPLEMFLDNVEGHLGDLDFQGISAPMRATFFYQIVDIEKVIYAVDDLVGSLKAKADHLLRAFFGNYTIDEAIMMKGFFSMENVASLIDVSSDSPNDKLPLNELREMVVTKEQAKQTEFYRILRKWGVEPVSFAVSDIELPDEIKKERMRTLTAQKDKEVAVEEQKIAKIKKETTKTDAEAESEKRRLEGEGEAKKVKAIIDQTNLKPQEAVSYLVSTVKWESIGKNANVTIIEESGGKTSDGVKIGVGIGATVKK